MLNSNSHSSVDWRPKYQLQANVILNAEKNLREERKAGLITNPAHRYIRRLGGLSMTWENRLDAKRIIQIPP